MTMRVIWVVLALSITPPVHGGVEDLEIHGNVVTARIELPGGISADLTIHFEQAVGLTEENLGLSAELVAVGDPGLLARLPAGAGASIPIAFPVLLRCAAPVTGALSFSGVAEIELYTHNLVFTTGSSLRLFASEPGGAFEDVTVAADAGSFRAGGLQPDWSQDLLIVLDPRAVSDVVERQIDEIDGVLTGHAEAIESSVFAVLDDLLVELRALYQSGSVVPAIVKLEELIEIVRDHSGADIPDVWRASGDLDNVAGELRSSARALRFSLLREANSLF